MQRNGAALLLLLFLSEFFCLTEFVHKFLFRLRSLYGGKEWSHLDRLSENSFAGQDPHYILINYYILSNI